MILYVFRNHYTMHVTAAMFYRTVSIIGHGLLLVVPGIIKHYEYSLIPYILAENPTMQYEKGRAQLSTKMSEGQKMAMLKMDLSFLFWEIAGNFFTGSGFGVLHHAVPGVCKGRAL